MPRGSIGPALFAVWLAVSAPLRGGAIQVQSAPPAQGSPGQVQSAVPPPPQGAITGMVYDAITGQPVAAATVILSKTTGSFSFPRSITDSQGRFVFKNLEPSPDYYLGAQRFGYEYTRYGWTGPDQSAAISDIARIAVAKDQWVSDIRIPLWRAGSISGRVLDERQEPLVGVAVRVFSRRMVSGQEDWVAGEIATTDDRGVYRFSIKKPDRYIVAVLSVQSTVLQTAAESLQTLAVGQLATGGISAGRGGSVAMPAINVDGTHRLVVTNFATPPPPSTDQPRAYPATFYPGVVSAASATALEVRYGADRTNIDIQIRPVPAVRVAGRLVMPGGEPVAPLLLRLMPAGMERLGFGGEAATTTVDKDGTFVFLNVPAGSYTLLGQASVADFTTGGVTRFPDAPGFPAGGIGVGSMNAAPGMEFLARSGAPLSVYGRMPVSVGTDPVSDLALVMRRTTSVSGRVVFPEGFSPPENLSVGVGVEPATADPTLSQSRGPVDFKQPGYPFTISGLLGGEYLFNGGISSNQPGLLGSLRVASVMWQNRDILTTGFDASAGDIRDVVITLTDKKIVLTGNVVNRGGPSTSIVIAFPTDRARWTKFGWNPRNFATARSGPSGSFRMEYLSAGEYYLVAVDPAFQDAWVDPKFLAAAVPFAARLTLEWGDTRAQDLTLATVVVK